MNLRKKILKLLASNVNTPDNQNGSQVLEPDLRLS
jgi:hypothetical protein